MFSDPNGGEGGKLVNKTFATRLVVGARCSKVT